MRGIALTYCMIHPMTHHMPHVMAKQVVIGVSAQFQKDRIMAGYAAMQRADTERCDVATGDNSNCTAESRQVSRP